jgi:hypothetical protein
VSLTFSEREAIVRMMSYIEEERARLWEDYSKLLDRLRQLDEIDRPLIKAAPSPFIPDSNIMLFNAPQAPQWEATPIADETSVPPIEEEGEPIEEPQQGSTVEEEEQAQYETSDPAGENEYVFSFEDYLEKATEENKSKFTKEIEELKDKDAKNNPLKTPSTRDVKIVSQYVRAILKEAGVPLKTAELIKRMKEANIDTSSPYVLLSQVRNYDNKVENVAHGFYQYKW